MRAQEYTPVADCLALTVRKEHSLIIKTRIMKKVFHWTN